MRHSPLMDIKIAYRGRLDKLAPGGKVGLIVPKIGQKMPVFPIRRFSENLIIR
jgi:hypothetical protein